MKDSGLRGRGGAGFPTGLKWSFMPKESDGRPALSGRQCRRIRAGHLQGPRNPAPRSAHAGRGLPGRRFRHGRDCGLHLRARRVHPRARAPAGGDRPGYDAKLIGKNNKNGYDFDIYVHHGAGAYICGEETALLESLEGKKGQPRLKPPFPANVGLYGCPTTVNNVESIAVAPTILRRGGGWFAASAVRTTPAPSCSASLVTSTAGTFEEELGVPFRELIDKHCGGIRGGWDNLLAVIPGGSSVPCVYGGRDQGRADGFRHLRGWAPALAPRR
jgi:NADH-quinone oxidoreductase subunit F